MKIFDKRNLVYFAAQEAWDRYSSHLEGLLSGPFCVVSEKALADDAKKALEATSTTLEYGQRAVTYITILPHEVTSRSSQEARSDGPLSPSQLFGIVESVDPLVIVAADAKSMSLLSHAYQTELNSSGPARLFGRNAVGFVDFAAMLADPEQKKHAWVHLKRLGHKPKPR